MAHFEVLMAGTGGQGLVFCSSFLAEAAIKTGKNVVQTQSYGISQRGGFISAEVIIDDGEIMFQQMTKPDVIIAFSDVVGTRYDDAACPVVYDTTIMKARNFPNWIGIPMMEIAEELGAGKSANLVGLAGAMSLCGAISLEDLLALAEAKGKPEIARANMEVLRRGVAAVATMKGNN